MVSRQYAADVCAAGFAAIAAVQLISVLCLGGYSSYIAWSFWRRAIDGTLDSGRNNGYELRAVLSANSRAQRDQGEFEEIDLIPGGKRQGQGDKGRP